MIPRKKDYYQIILRPEGFTSQVWRNGKEMLDVVSVHVDADLEGTHILLELEGDDVDIWTGYDE